MMRVTDNPLSHRDRQLVTDLCDRLGADVLLREIDRQQKLSPHGFKITVLNDSQAFRCECSESPHCGWCYGYGWVGARVANIQSLSEQVVNVYARGPIPTSEMMQPGLKVIRRATQGKPYAAMSGAVGWDD